MADGITKTAAPTQWKWVVIGVVVGLVIIGGSFFIVAPTFHSTAIQSLVSVDWFRRDGRCRRLFFTRCYY